MSLGEFKETEFTPDDRNSLLPKLQEIHRTADDPGLHASVEWLLRQGKQEVWLTRVNDEWAKDNEGRDRKIARIKELVNKGKETPPQWYVNTQGQMLVVIPGPVEFRMGSSVTEVGRHPQGREVAEDTEDGLDILDTRGRVLRGGVYQSIVTVRSFFRFSFRPPTRNAVIGFRLARTFG